MLTFALFALVIVLFYVVVRQHLTIRGLRTQQTHLIWLIEAAKVYGKWSATQYYDAYATFLDSAPGFTQEWHRYVSKSKKAHTAIVDQAARDYDKSPIVAEWYDTTKPAVIDAIKAKEVSNG